MTRAELEPHIRGLDKAERNAKTCAILGHSRIVRRSGTELSCGRCGVVLPPSADQVVVGRKMLVDRRNYKNTTWRDRVYCAEPFTIGENHA